MTLESGMGNGVREELVKRERPRSTNNSVFHAGLQSSLSSCFPSRQLPMLSFPTNKKEVSDHGRFLGL